MASDPVDLRDKKGVVDPADLKKHDPKPPPPPKAPPSPETERGPAESSQYDVHKSHQEHIPATEEQAAKAQQKAED